MLLVSNDLVMAFARDSSIVARPVCQQPHRWQTVAVCSFSADDPADPLLPNAKPRSPASLRSAGLWPTGVGRPFWLSTLLWLSRLPPRRRPVRSCAISLFSHATDRPRNSFLQCHPTRFLTFNLPHLSRPHPPALARHLSHPAIFLVLMMHCPAQPRPQPAPLLPRLRPPSRRQRRKPLSQLASATSAPNVPS